MHTVATVLENAGVAGIYATPRQGDVPAPNHGGQTAGEVSFQTWRQVEYFGQDMPPGGGQSASARQDKPREPGRPFVPPTVPPLEGCAHLSHARMCHVSMHAPFDLQKSCPVVCLRIA